MTNTPACSQTSSSAAANVEAKSFENRSASLKLGTTLTIWNAEVLRQQLADAIVGARDKRLALDLSAVQNCDASALQLLYSAVKFATEKNVKLAIVATSAAVEDAISALALPVRALIGDHESDLPREIASIQKEDCAL